MEEFFADNVDTPKKGVEWNMRQEYSISAISQFKQKQIQKMDIVSDKTINKTYGE